MGPAKVSRSSPIVSCGRGHLPLGLAIQFLSPGQGRLAVRLGASAFRELAILRAVSQAQVAPFCRILLPRVVFLGPANILKNSVPKLALVGVEGCSALIAGPARRSQQRVRYGEGEIFETITAVMSVASTIKGLLGAGDRNSQPPEKQSNSAAITTARDIPGRCCIWSIGYTPPLAMMSKGEVGDSKKERKGREGKGREGETRTEGEVEMEEKPKQRKRCDGSRAEAGSWQDLVSQ